MADVRFRCPACGAKHKADVSLAGKVTECVECHREMTIPAESTPVPPSGLLLPSPDAMPALQKRISDLEGTKSQLERTLATTLQRAEQAEKDCKTAQERAQELESSTRQLQAAKAEADSLRSRLKETDLIKDQLAQARSAMSADQTVQREKDELKAALEKASTALQQCEQESAAARSAAAGLASQLKLQMAELQSARDAAKAELEQLRRELDDERKARADSSQQVSPATGSGSRQIEELRGKYASLSFELKTRADELARMKAERDQALALAQGGVAGDSKTAAEQVAKLTARFESADRARRDLEIAAAENAKRIESLKRENELLNSRLRTFTQALRQKS